MKSFKLLIEETDPKGYINNAIDELSLATTRITDRKQQANVNKAIDFLNKVLKGMKSA